MSDQLGQRFHGRNDIPHFSVRVHAARMVNLLGMLRQVGYAPEVVHAREGSDGLTEAVIELGCSSERVAELVSAWLRTIPGVEAVTLV